MKYPFAVCLTLLLFCAPASAESVYKWTDDEGVTHFGDRQPTDRDSESVDVRSGTSSPSAGSRTSPQEQVEDIEKAQYDQQVREEISREEEAQKKQMNKNCEIAKKNLQTLKTYNRIKIEEEGQQRYLTPEEIKEKRAEFQEMVEQNCQPQSNQ